MWDLEQATEMQRWAQSHLAQDHAWQQDMQDRLRDLAFCQHVLDNMAARSEFK